MELLADITGVMLSLDITTSTSARIKSLNQYTRK